VKEYERIVVAAGLSREELWSTWDRDPWDPDADYQLSVHRRRSMPA
jgi:hypothetical protein